MKRWLKITLISIVIIAVGLVGAFLYVDYKVTQAMVNMMRKQEEMARQVEDSTIAKAPNIENSIDEDSDNSAELDSDSNEIEDVNENNDSKSDVNMNIEKVDSNSELVSVEGETVPMDQVNTSSGESNDQVTIEKSPVDQESKTVEPSANNQSDASLEVNQEEDPEAEKEVEQEIDQKTEKSNPQQPKTQVREVEEVVAETPSVEEVTEETTIQERAKAYEMAFSKLSQSQVDRLFEMSNGGFTQEEKEEAKAMFYANFTLEEQEWIMDMYRKHY